MRLAKKRLIILTSIVCTVLVLWFLILGKIKATNFLSPFLGNVPKSKEDLAEAGKDVLGTAEEAAASKNAQKILEESSKFFETSEVTEPLRQMRETVIQRINETIESIKELPEREIKTIKKEVCKQWMEEE